MSKATEEFTVEELAVNDLVIDRRVQREGLNRVKVREIVTEYNHGALGVVTVSLRTDRSLVIIDGQHRVEATRIVTDNVGLIKCHVFRGLTLAEEAAMFLALNNTTKPPIIDKFKVLRSAEGVKGDAARDIAELLGAYGFQISNVAANGNINAVNVVVRLYELSRKLDAEPNLIVATILTISRAWGNDRFGTQGPILEGIGRMYAEYGSRLDLDHLISVLKDYQGGPRSLLGEARQLSALTKSKVSMAVAEILVTHYNKGRRSRSLEKWRMSS